MNFFSQKIANPVGPTQTWDEYLQSVLNKEASEAKPESDGDPRGQGRGQVINNDNEEGAESYQKGESVDGKDDQCESGDHKPNSKKADCGKDMGECDGAGKVTEDHSDAGNADVGNAAVTQNINNDPNYQKGESTNPGSVDGKNKKETGESSKGSDDADKGSDDADKGSDDSDKEASTKKVTKAASKSGFKKIASMNRKEKVELFAAMSAKKSKSGTAAWPISYVEAMVGLTFANMQDDEKAWFQNFWQTMYPDSYVAEMVADR